ncbi:group 1 glycosyl transferase [Shewanella sp. AC34-MNA-CIBAN-0136]|uniref:group 1 glycosyl transferase n=1 Tax=Shewanella sp. AC34-MNA-CIBAN-0136 TaxID=3140463 RepID=UPI003328E9A6
MRVLHITNAFPYDGHPEYGCFINEQIHSLSDKVSSEVLFINAHKNGTLEYLRSLSNIRKMVKNVDVIHCHHLFSFIALKLSFSTKKPVVLSFLNDWTKEVKLNIPELLKHHLCSFFVKLPEKVIFKSFVPDFLKGERFVFLPNGVDTDFFNILEQKESRKKLDLCSKANYLLFVSSKNLFRHQKRYDIFLNVIDELQAKYPSFNYKPLTMSTDDRIAARLKINSASLHLLCSDYEGSPNSVKEALSSGLPVVSRPAGSVEDLLFEMPYTSLVRSDCSKIISEEVHKIISQPVDRNKIRDSLILKSISKEQVADKLFKLYISLVKNI